MSFNPAYDLYVRETNEQGIRVRTCSICEHRDRTSTKGKMAFVRGMQAKNKMIQHLISDHPEAYTLANLEHKESNEDRPSKDRDRVRNTGHGDGARLGMGAESTGNADHRKGSSAS